MFLDRQSPSACADEARDIPGEHELKSIDDTALSRSIWPADGKVLAAEVEGKIADATEFLYAKFLCADHNGSSPNSAARRLASVGFASRMAGRRRLAMSP